jgi:branched-chain amino acid transport system substrate-binding protein
VVVDSESSASEFQTAAQDLVQNKGVFGIVSDSAFTYGGSSYLTEAGVPVTGDTFDGPEWGTSPNMFTYAPPTYTSYGGTTYGYDDVSKMLKSVGAKKVAVLAYGISPSAVLGAQQLVAADAKVGLSNCYSNFSVPFGAVDFTADVLQIQHAGCDAVVGTFVAASNIALAAALKDAGVKAAQFYYTSYAQSTLQSAGAKAALNGTYSEGLIATGHMSSAQAMAKFYDELKMYDPTYSGGVPDIGVINSWDATDVMIEGLKLAGSHPTRASFIGKLRTVTHYDLGGLSASPVSFNYLSGHLESQECANFVELKGAKFVPVPANGSAICGSLVPLKS